MHPRFAKFTSRISNPVLYRLFLLEKLPLVYFTGIRIRHLDETSCITTVRYSWINRNPFKSMYFAVMQMAAELSTGTLCMGKRYQSDANISMLVVKTSGEYYRKATGRVYFTCKDGAMIEAMISAALNGDGPCVAECSSDATNENGEIIATFRITWSFKRRSAA